MIYRCLCCNATFSEPYTRVELENLDGENGWETRCVETCPWCGCEEYEYNDFEEEDEEE